MSQLLQLLIVSIILLVIVSALLYENKVKIKKLEKENKDKTKVSEMRAIRIVELNEELRDNRKLLENYRQMLKLHRTLSDRNKVKTAIELTREANKLMSSTFFTGPGSNLPIPSECYVEDIMRIRNQLYQNFGIKEN